jgi:hypothetical protein
MKQPDLATAIKLFYAKSELTNKDIKLLFGTCPSHTTKLKNQVKQAMAEQGVKTFYPNTVNTRVAYQVWGIDVADYEARLKKLRNLKFAE